ncbi:ABC transporter ATP-binding protein [Lapillicoccus sp.]|uniref:ABC transporter ATP-binding protein n=1 Tax=Lapillicoccus sp. TaxID=1909287 RepID=UPI003263B011
MDVVQATSISRSYGETLAVDGLDLNVPEGQIVAILGPNGAGKTTTIEMLLGLRRPDSGKVRLFARQPDSPYARARVGSMLQDHVGPENLTVRETVALVRRYYPWALPVDGILDRADLVGKQRSKIGELSGGQRQRLSFALAIAGDPDLLFLDEPTAALDVVARTAFWQQVRAFATLGKTILFSSHNLGETDDVADRIVVIDHGRLVADDTPAGIKGLVADRTVHLTTDASREELAAMDGVKALDAVDGTQGESGSWVVQTRRPEHLLETLFSRGRTVTGLQVVETDLEAAFLHLTRASGERAA